MPTIQIEATVSQGELLRAVEQLSPPELEAFVRAVLQLRSRRAAPTALPAEADLLRTINRGLPEETWRRFDELKAKRRAETLTPEEHAELLTLGDAFERLEGQRLQALTDLAQLRKTTVTQVMHDLGIRAPAHE